MRTRGIPAATSWSRPEAHDLAHRKDTLPIDLLLSRVRGPKKTGPNSWMAFCPTREERTRSLSVRELPDGALLLHDFGGDATGDVLASIGLNFSDLYPRTWDRERQYAAQAVRKPRIDFQAWFDAVEHRLIVLALAMEDLASGEQLSVEDSGYIAACARELWDLLREARS